MQNIKAASQSPPGRVLTVQQVARMLCRSPRTIRYWADLGILPGFKIGLRQWSFLERDIQARMGPPTDITNFTGSTGTDGSNGGR
jgi:hypothetical protein